MSKTPVGKSAAQDLEWRIFALEAERDCHELLTLYGLYADFGLADEWVGIFTEDAVMEFNYFDDSAYLDEKLNPLVDDPTTVGWPEKFGRFVGHEELYEAATEPRHKRLVGRCQHQTGGQPSVFRLLDDETALIISDAIIYSRAVGNYAPEVAYQNHSLNRWVFRRVDGRWRISENIRKVLGSDGGRELLAGI